MNISAIGAKSFFTLTGELVSTSGASTIWLLEASRSVCPVGRRARHRRRADGAGAARHVLEHEALPEGVLELVGVEAEVLAKSAGAGRRDHRTLRDGQPSTVAGACARTGAPRPPIGRAGERADGLTSREHAEPPQILVVAACDAAPGKDA